MTNGHVEDKLEQLEAKKAARRDEQAKKARAQLAIDEEAIQALELAGEHGDDLIRVDVNNYVEGLPVRVAARYPKPAEFKRYQDQLARAHSSKAGDKVAPGNTLAAACRVYPDAETYAQLCEKRAAVHISLANAINDAASGRSEDEKKD